MKEFDGVSETEIDGAGVVLERAGAASGAFIVGIGAAEGRVGILAFLSELVSGRGLADTGGSAGLSALPLRVEGLLVAGTSGGLGVVLRLGTSGARPLIGSGTLISGMEGGLDVVFRLCTSGARFVVGLSGAAAPDFVWSEARGASGTAEMTSLSSTTFQSFLKDTIGRPGASETAVGVGSFALRSLRRNPVAARSSSLLISLPSFIFTSGTFSASAFAFSADLAPVGFSV